MSRSIVSSSPNSPSAPRRRALRVGSVPYLVARPLDTGLETQAGIELVRDVPARLVAGLRKGELDVALVSSIELFRRPGYRFLDGLGVCGRGAVSSVRVFLRKPLAELRTVALDPASRAAATLVQIVLSPAFDPARREPVRFLDTPAGRDPRDVAADGWLRIGDRALREVCEPCDSFDPCAAWTAATGRPFAFAVWIVRPRAALEEDELSAFARARARGARAVDALARDAAAQLELPVAFLRRYLTEECSYDPGAELRPALHVFRDAAARQDLCAADLDPLPLDVPLPCRPA